MAAAIQITCDYVTPAGLEWAGQINSSFDPPRDMIDGREVKLAWESPTSIDVAPNQRHQLEIYFCVFDVLRICGAEIEVEPLRDGETRSYRYEVELKDRYLNRGTLRVERSLS